jgi:hypothetical protein
MRRCPRSWVGFVALLSRCERRPRTRHAMFRIEIDQRFIWTVCIFSILFCACFPRVKISGYGRREPFSMEIFAVIPGTMSSPVRCIFKICLPLFGIRVRVVVVPLLKKKNPQISSTDLAKSIECALCLPATSTEGRTVFRAASAPHWSTLRTTSRYTHRHSDL